MRLGPLEPVAAPPPVQGPAHDPRRDAGPGAVDAERGELLALLVPE
ncbi:hypothetical protein ACFXKK_05170 [Streptomyces globisporus]